MLRNLIILGCAVIVIALPFIFREPEEQGDWREGDPVLVVISPHNEAIRHELARGFSRWHAEKFGKPVKVDWRVIGGTTEIVRYLNSEYISAFRGWWTGQGKAWPAGASANLTNRKFKPDGQPAELVDVRNTFIATDDSEHFSSQIDVFFGGGEYDHNKIFRQGISVPPWTEAPPDTVEFFPERLSGETWRSEGFIGTALSTFGIVYNIDRLEDLGIEQPPARWEDLTDPRYFRQLGVADPTKSGSITKAFEMMIHQQVYLEVRKAGFDDARIAAFEKSGEWPDAYQAAVEQGWLKGIRLVQRIGANARYFTNLSSKVPIDVSIGDAAVGIAIDFYGRFQAENSRAPDGSDRMAYVTPQGGSSVSCDPVSLLRGASERELGVRFIRFMLSTEGQRLWNYRVGTPGGPEKFALRRLPIRSDFYPSDDPARQAVFEAHRPHLADDFGDPSVNPYAVAESFTYYARWTGKHFNVHRNLIRAMCLDAGDELKAAWKAIIESGGPGEVVKSPAMKQLEQLPPGLDWNSALGYGSKDRLEYMRDWTIFFRDSYREAERLAGAPE